MSAKLKLRIEKLDKGLLIEVLEQDERFWRKSSSLACLTYTAPNGFSIRSEQSPEMGDYAMWLLGDRTSSPRWFFRRFNTDAERDVYLKKMLDALEAWRLNAKEFVAPQADAAGTVYTFA